MPIEDDCPLFIKQPKKREISPAQQIANEEFAKPRNPLKQIFLRTPPTVAPFFRVRDLNNPVGDNDGRKPVTAVEAGIKISF